MARRPNHLHPQPRIHSKTGHGRVRIAGQEYWLGRYGSPEAAAEYDRLIGEWLASGKKHPPSRRHAKAKDPATEKPTAIQRAAFAVDSRAPDRSDSVPKPEIHPPAIPSRDAQVALAFEPADSQAGSHSRISVGELCTHWMNWIERNRCHRGKDSTSLYYGARQVTIALEDFWSYPAASFGSRNLLQVQEKLVHTPVVSRPKDPTKPPQKRPRYRSTINDTVNRIRQMFRWGVINELVPEDRIPLLQLIPPLLRGQTSAPDRHAERTVADEVVDATLPEMPRVAADLVRFQRLVGCRPGEARRLRPCDIDMRDLPEYQGTWVWKPYRHKNEWRRKHLPRLVVIGPKAQAVLRPWLAKLAGRPDSHVFSPKFAERRACGGTRTATTATPRVPVSKRLVNDCYAKDSLNQVIERACRRAKVAKWTANQLRHTRLTEVRATVSPDAAQAVGGHSSFNQTEHYARVHLEKAIDAAARCG